MPLEAPRLDDRTFDDIVAEAQALIPRYTPEWTNHNRSDPGITLLQLFAWMAEALVYRMNRVPERNYVKFLELLGIQLQPARPATAELQFTLARDDLDTVAIPRGTRVGVAGADPPLVFETDEPLLALGAKLAAVQSFDGFSYSNRTARNAVAGQTFEPFGPHADEGSALLLGFSSPLQFTAERVDLALDVHTEGVQPEGRDCDADLGAVPLPALLVWEYWDGRRWRALRLDRDETRALTRSGHVAFRGPGADARRARIGDVQEERYWIRLRLERGTYERAPRLEGVLTSCVRATQALTVRDEVLGGSDGTPGQAFQLANVPVVELDGLEIDEDQGFAPWTEVDDFLESTPEDQHYVLDRSAGAVTFGDGERGRIPLLNVQLPTRNVVVRRYRYGGDVRGNVGAGTITELQTFIEGLRGVTNLRAAEGGTAEETLERAKLRAPAELKAKQRAVTAEDYETLARATPGANVRRAKALPLTHPRFADARIPGVVTVIVVPDSPRPDPQPTEATLAAVCAHLNRHRLVAAELHVMAPRYREIRVTAEVVARQDADPAALANSLEADLARYFHPLEGGDDGTGWEFGRTVFYSEVYRLILHNPDVARIEENQLLLDLDGERQPFCRDVPIGDGVLLRSGAHEIRAIAGGGLG